MSGCKTEVKVEVNSSLAVDLRRGDCLELLKSLPDQSVDLILTSPPYGDSRTYGDLKFRLAGDDWVRWAFERYMECNRVCRGAVVWVVDSKTSDFQWTGLPMLLFADLHRAGVRFRKPAIMRRNGFCGSGGPDYWRNDYEFILVSSHGRLPWSDNTACGTPPKFPAGGPISHRDKSGRRADDVAKAVGRSPRRSPMPAIANPGNVIDVKVGGGHMGDEFAHENEAPFSESLAERFVLSFCPPSGVVLDPMCGSGTTLKTALKHGRSAIGFEIRESQLDVVRRRLKKFGEFHYGRIV